jgi:hypothetical protein
MKLVNMHKMAVEVYDLTILTKLRCLFTPVLHPLYDCLTPDSQRVAPASCLLYLLPHALLPLAIYTYFTPALHLRYTCCPTDYTRLITPPALRLPHTVLPLAIYTCFTPALRLLYT